MVCCWGAAPAAACLLWPEPGGEAEGPTGDFFEYTERLRNYERSDVPRGAGADSDEGFDLGRYGPPPLLAR